MLSQTKESNIIPEKKNKFASKNRLQDFLNKNKAEKGEHTLVSASFPRGSFSITDYEKFWKYYNQAVIDNHELYLIERCHESFAPIRIDLDFIIKTNKPQEKYYNDNNIKKFIKLLKESVEEGSIEINRIK